MMYPLVRELAADGIPVAVTCRLLKIARQPYYRWLADPVTATELAEAYLANALFDAHREGPEFGYRYLADEARDAGQSACDRTMWRVCSTNGWWSVFGKKRGKNGKKTGPPVHDLVQRDFTAEAPNRLWLSDITEHRTGEGKLYLCAIKDVYSNRIVGYSISDRMKSRLAVDAVAFRAPGTGATAGVIIHADRGCQGGFNWSSQHLVMIEVSGGSTTAGSRPSDPSADEVTWSSEVQARRRGCVLGRDREGVVAGRGGDVRGRVAAGRAALVPQRWRHAAGRRQEAALGAVPIVCRARGDRAAQGQGQGRTRDRARDRTRPGNDLS
jgi:hypothetical protein